MKFIHATVVALTLASAVNATESTPGYAGQEFREIKALSPGEIEGLLAGMGLGYGKSAELNRYPGPAHVLELADELELTETQLQDTRAIHARMEGQAKALGARLVAAEAALDQLFQSEAVNETGLKAALSTIGEIQAELRGVHLLAHVEQREVLSSQQITRYVHLRGYHDGHGGSGHGH